jgi:hypothetical protein
MTKIRNFFDFLRWGWIFIIFSHKTYFFYIMCYVLLDDENKYNKEYSIRKSEQQKSELTDQTTPPLQNERRQHFTTRVFPTLNYKRMLKLLHSCPL